MLLRPICQFQNLSGASAQMLNLEHFFPALHTTKFSEPRLEKCRPDFAQHSDGAVLSPTNHGITGIFTG
ncbi:hypothetical protein EAO27_12800 [Sphingopyxis sp. YF1]|nr:hypothetical protein EAO27_12800 [Sphingopyxis sp. YF1]